MRAARTRLLVPLVIAAALGPLLADEQDPAQGVVVVRGATIWTQADAGRIEGGTLVVRDGKIVAVGRDVAVPANATVIDGSGKHLTPGLVDCHSHTAIRGGVNEGSNNVTAEVRIGDVLDPDSVNIYRQLAGGLTTAHLLHGSANSIGGQDAVIKLKWGATREQLLIADAAAGIKFALGENPKRSNVPPRPDRPPRYPATRMGVMESIRERFIAARDYMREWEAYDALGTRARARRKPPRRDLQLEAIAEILRGERRIHSHSYRQDEILALLRLAEEFDIRIGTFQHVLEGYKVADELAAHGAGASTFSDWWGYKLEAFDAIPFNGALMHERGVRVSFNSDSSELARRMNLEAAKAVKYGGVAEEDALDFVTLNAAEQLGIAHRVGSLEAGKDADFVLWSADPLSVYSIVEQTWVEGVRQFDRMQDLAAREAIEADRRELIERVRSGDRARDEDAVQAGDERQTEDPTDEQDAEARSLGAPAKLDYRDRLAASSSAYSILHATIHTASGETIEDGTVSFRRGRIVEVGPRLAPLAEARQIDARGKHVYPGMIDANTVVGLTEIGSVAGSVDVSELGEINPNVNTAIALNPDSELIPVTRANGLTHTLSVPSGGLVSGSSSLIRLDGWTWEDLVAASPAAMHIRWPSYGVRRSSGSGPSEQDQKKRREERLKRIRELFADARAYARARAAAAVDGPALDSDPALEAMQDVLDGRLPLIVHASELRQIHGAVEWAAQEGVRITIAGAGDLWRAAELLREHDIPVIVTSVLSLPRHEDEPYDTAFTLPAKLHRAGVRFCIASSGSRFGAHTTRNLPYHAAMAAAFGLDPDEALRAVTLYPAQILGVGDALGSIEPGKSASLIVTDGDPLEIRTRIERAFIDGRPVELRANRHQRLYDKYRSRPAAAR